MVLIERTKEETYVRYRIRPLSNAVIGAEKTFNKLRTAELNAMYWAHETGSYYEIIEEEVHAKSIKVIAQDRTEVKDVV